MKKIVVFVMVLAIICGIVGCGMNPKGGSHAKTEEDETVYELTAKRIYNSDNEVVELRQYRYGSGLLHL